MQNRYLNQLAILTDLLDANSVRLNAELQLTSAYSGYLYLLSTGTRLRTLVIHKLNPKHYV